MTNCYQRLEFLGDAVLDFLITRHLFDHPSRRFTPGELTDLRAALVNNNIFAALAVKFWYHKYLHALTPDLHNVIRDYVLYCEQQDDVEGMEAALTKGMFFADNSISRSNSNGTYKAQSLSYFSYLYVPLEFLLEIEISS